MRHEKGSAERATSVVRCQKFASICTVSDISRLDETLVETVEFLIR